MKKRHAFFMGALLATNILAGPAAFSQSPEPPLANNAADDNRVNETPFAEERSAAQSFIENVNEARKELTVNEPTLARQKIIMARNLLPIIMRVTPEQSRLTRVEFGGGLYADDLSDRKSYVPIETQTLENLTRTAGPRWIKNTRSESDSKIIYISLDLSNRKAETYLDQAEKYIVAGDMKNAGAQLAELSDMVIKVDDRVPAAIQARDYLTLANNYIRAGNFFGARNSLESAKDGLDKMRDDDTYKVRRLDIIALRQDIENLQEGFAKLDADQIRSAEANLKKWQELLASWVGE